MQIIPNVYLVNGFPYSRHQNGYVVKTGDEGHPPTDEEAYNTSHSLAGIHTP